jgi:hypothetical protein
MSWQLCSIASSTSSAFGDRSTQNSSEPVPIWYTDQSRPEHNFDDCWREGEDGNMWLDEHTPEEEECRDEMDCEKDLHRRAGDKCY